MNAINVNGLAGVVSSTSHNYRGRDSRVQIRPEDLERMQQLWVEYGTAGMEAFLHEHYDRRYVEDWHFVDITKLEWTSSTTYEDY